MVEVRLTHLVLLQRLDGRIVRAVATKDIKNGMLVIPVFCRREQSFVVPSCPTSRAAFQVMGNVKWTSPPEAEGGARTTTVSIGCQPETRLPLCRPGVNIKPNEYTAATDCHPFWHIERVYGDKE